MNRFILAVALALGMAGCATVPGMTQAERNAQRTHLDLIRSNMSQMWDRLDALEKRVTQDCESGETASKGDFEKAADEAAKQTDAELCAKGYSWISCPRGAP